MCYSSHPSSVSCTANSSCLSSTHKRTAVFWATVVARWGLGGAMLAHRNEKQARVSFVTHSLSLFCRQWSSFERTSWTEAIHPPPACHRQPTSSLRAFSQDRATSVSVHSFIYLVTAALWIKWMFMLSMLLPYMRTVYWVLSVAHTTCTGKSGRASKGAARRAAGQAWCHPHLSPNGAAFFELRSLVSVKILFGPVSLSVQILPVLERKEASCHSSKTFPQATYSKGILSSPQYVPC